MSSRVDAARPRSSHQLERGDDRRQRIAQLVAEHRQELVLGGVGALGLGARGGGGVLQPLALDGVADRARQQEVLRLTFDEVLLGAEAHALERDVEVARASSSTTIGVAGASAATARQRLGAVGVGKPEVEQHDVERALARGARAPRRAIGAQVELVLRRVGLVEQHLAQKARVAGLVLDEQDAQSSLISCPRSARDARP